MRVELTVPEFTKKKVGEYLCKCQRTELDMEEKEARVFWKKSLNEVVKQEEVLCELEMEKVTGEIRSPYTGRLVEICIEDGDSCFMGSLLGVLETD